MADIDAEGDVEDSSSCRVIRNLFSAAPEAVRQWKYKACLLDGQPVKAETQVVVAFELRLE